MALGQVGNPVALGPIATQTFQKRMTGKQCPSSHLHLGIPEAWFLAEKLGNNPVGPFYNERSARVFRDSIKESENQRATHPISGDVVWEARMKVRT